MCSLEQEPVLGIERYRLARRDAKQRRIKAIDAGQEATAARYHAADRLRVGTVIRIDIPTIGRHLRGGVDAVTEVRHRPSRSTMPPG
jgi:hypothetical protein